MFTTKEIIEMVFPVFSHWTIWLIFLAAAIIVLALYTHQYIKKPNKIFRRYEAGIPVISIISLYVFTKLLEGVIYNGPILKIDSMVNETMVVLQNLLLTKIAFFFTGFGSSIPIIVIMAVTTGILLLRKR
jgi:hypothetical protein